MECTECHKTQAWRRGLCARCYRRALKAEREERLGPCPVEDCDRPQWAAGLCQTHYQRRTRDGSLGDRPRLRRRKGEGHVNAAGYRLVTVAPGVTRLEHRWVMERELGRELVAGEMVHHRNGDRLDNRLENLELCWRQPPGQRVEDLVAYLRETGWTVARA